MTETGGSAERSTRPGPVHDNAIRRLMEGNLPDACRLLGVAVKGPLEVVQASFPAATLTADLVARTAPGRLIHVEYMIRTSPDLVPRMLIYRGHIMRDHPRHRLSQHVMVLERGRVSGHDDLAGNGFALDLRVVYCRDLDPETLLAVPGLAPLAVLGRGDRGTRTSALARAVRAITEHAGPRAPELLQAAAVLATIRLDTPTIEKILKEAGMTVEGFARLWRDTETGAALRQEGRQEGLQEGVQVGRQESLHRVLTVLLRQRFGDDPAVGGVAQRLSGWPEEDALAAVASAADPGSVPLTPPVPRTA